MIYENLLFLINILVKLSICSGALNETGSCFAQVGLDLLVLGDFPPSASQVAWTSLLLAYFDTNMTKRLDLK